MNRTHIHRMLVICFITTHHRCIEHSILCFKVADTIVMRGNVFDRLCAEPESLMLRWNKLVIICTFECSWEGIVHRNTKRTAGQVGTNQDFPVIARLIFAGFQCVFNQIAEYNRNIGIWNEDIIRNLNFNKIINTVILSLLSKVEQYSVCGSIFAVKCEESVKLALTSW